MCVCVCVCCVLCMVVDLFVPWGGGVKKEGCCFKQECVHFLRERGRLSAQSVCLLKQCKRIFHHLKAPRRGRERERERERKRERERERERGAVERDSLLEL